MILNCESFRDLGGWVLETQSTLQLGCGYLMAHGMGVPVADAVGEAEIPAAGRYAVWARTRNWNAPWTGGAAGRFRILVNDAPLEAELGGGTPDWHWAKAGEIDLPAGRARIALRDLTGFNGRCAAVAFAPCSGLDGRFAETSPPPDQTPTTLQGRDAPAARQPSVADDPAVYDLVVVGGGVAGCCAALAAARCGATSLLLQDRPVLGGCNSSENCVAMGGALHQGPYPNLGRIVEEIQPLFGYGTPIEPRYHEDARKESAFHVREHYATRHWERLIPGTTPGLRLGQHVIGIEMDGENPRRIAAVLSRDTRTGAVTRIRARNFCDASGDALLARLSGCETMYGREAKSRFGEKTAPDAPDRRVMGMSVQWLTAERAEPAPFPDISDWALPIRVTSDCYRTCGSWEQETGFFRDMADDTERIRDYALLCIFSSWNWLKNKAPDRDRFSRLALSWMSPVGGKRESYRAVGDYVLTESDLAQHTPFDDATAAGTWDMDHHFPDPEGARGFPEPFRSAACHVGFGKPQPVPYRCLYARDCENLFLAGRTVSVSHAAFSAVRVMRTLGMLGEVVGMAAAICAEKGATPREVYVKHLDALKAKMEAGVPKLPQFHTGSCNHASIRYDFKREGKHLVFNLPPDTLPPDIADDVTSAGFPPPLVYSVLKG